jgi:hypothetical protein
MSAVIPAPEEGSNPAMVRTMGTLLMMAIYRKELALQIAFRASSVSMAKIFSLTTRETIGLKY